jgi:hypothetical protein
MLVFSDSNLLVLPSFADAIPRFVLDTIDTVSGRFSAG